MNTRYFLLFVSTLLLLGFYSCQQDEIKPVFRDYSNDDITKLFLNLATPDAESRYFISGEFDGTFLNFTSTFASTQLENDTIVDLLYIHPAVDLESLYMIRLNAAQNILIAFYVQQVKLSTLKLPYIAPHNNEAPGGFVQLDLINLARKDRRGLILKSEECEFSGYTSNASNTVNGIDFQINRFANNVVEGTFSGKLSSDAGILMSVKNGKFRVKVKQVYL
jgi:hypothetical protein